MFATLPKRQIAEANDRHMLDVLDDPELIEGAVFVSGKRQLFFAWPEFKTARYDVLKMLELAGEVEQRVGTDVHR